MKPRAGNFFEDFRLGQHFVHATPRTLSEGDRALYIALTGARHVVYCARPIAQALGYRDQPIDDLLLFHTAFAKTVPDISFNAIANLGYADLRFLAPCYVGDTIRAESEVIGLRPNANGRSGIVYVRSNAYNQKNDPVLTWARWVMVHQRDTQIPAQETIVPDLPTFVSAADLVMPNALLDAAAFAVATGCNDFWDDYAVGEMIDHVSGMTLDESDHTLATKLYQNNARVHFDARLMAGTPFGRRLIYGGHVMSVCRALSYAGLENVVCIAAINAGTHTHPTFAGDTLYARTEILDKWPIPQRADVGALRLRLLGTKNRPAAEVIQARVEGKPHPNLVLDLDYTVIMPRRGA